jgi:hypothetical protein
MASMAACNAVAGSSFSAHSEVDWSLSTVVELRGGRWRR